jgi:hypothetical protein
MVTQLAVSSPIRLRLSQPWQATLPISPNVQHNTHAVTRRSAKRNSPIKENITIDICQYGRLIAHGDICPLIHLPRWAHKTFAFRTIAQKIYLPRMTMSRSKLLLGNTCRHMLEGGNCRRVRLSPLIIKSTTVAAAAVALLCLPSAPTYTQIYFP